MPNARPTWCPTCGSLDLEYPDDQKVAWCNECGRKWSTETGLTPEGEPNL